MTTPQSPGGSRKPLGVDEILARAHSPQSIGQLSAKEIVILFPELQQAKQALLADLLEILKGLEKPMGYMPVKDMEGNLIEELEMMSPPDRGYNLALSELRQKLREYING